MNNNAINQKIIADVKLLKTALGDVYLSSSSTLLNCIEYLETRDMGKLKENAVIGKLVKI